ncbi:hypothetical protein E8E11_000328 [Didymella keratinophila]|nr:hypothetical protein E8E11_000328 [Didymella keratinophila]
MLKSASPPVLIESLNGLREPPPSHIEYLGDYLATGVDFHFIPLGLRDVIKNDSDVGHQIIKSADFDAVDSCSAEELSAVWEKVKTIFLNARDCKDGGRDENAWCDDVFRPLLNLAIQLYGMDRWWLQSVQSQSIDPRYLSTVAARSLTDSARRKAIDRKTDYVLSYSHRHPVTSALYKELGEANAGEVGHTTDAFTKRTALFSGFEIKPASGDQTEAELQISIWSAASIRKKQELASLAQLPIEPAAMVEPMFTIVGHEHHVYYCYPNNHLVQGRSGVHVLGPDLDRFERLSTDSVRGVFRLLRMYRNVLAYGIDEGEDNYWGGFFGKTLTRLAGLPQERVGHPD